jgi:hypothetical protein
MEQEGTSGANKESIRSGYLHDLHTNQVAQQVSNPEKAPRKGKLYPERLMHFRLSGQRQT